MLDAGTINLSTEDTQANRSGEISGAQRRTLSRRRILFFVQAFVFIVLLVVILGLVYLKLRDPSFASRGELYLFIPIGLFWLWLLHRAPAQWSRTNQDLREGKISVIEGRVLGRWQNTLGFIQFPKYEIRVDDKVFSLSGDEFFQFKNQENYRIIYSPHSKLFLGAIPSPSSQSFSADPVEQSEELASLLSQRELEILQLMADGLSNKQIAGQLSLSVNTIKMYSSQIYQKMGVSRRTEAVSRARSLGIL